MDSIERPKSFLAKMSDWARTGLAVLFVGAVIGLVSYNSTASSAAGHLPLAGLSGYVVNGTGNSNVEQAHALLQNEGYQVYLIILSNQSPGVEGLIYRDLLQRHFRSTTGPDEGFDTHGEFCYPNCVYVPSAAVNAISVYGWVGVLRHEYRHINQAEHNPNLAQDFRSPNGWFTSYGAFSEACADYGLNEAPVYYAWYRINRLKSVLGIQQQTLIDAACSGNMPAYSSVVARYNQKMGSPRAFVVLFPLYR